MSDDDLDQLIDTYGEGNVRKAFWLQDEIRKDGLDGIHFMEYAEKEVKQFAPMITHSIIESQMKKYF